MLVFDKRVIGINLFSVRKKCGLTQSEVAEAAGLSDRTYADIERGTVNMRVETLLKICRALDITPNDVLTKEEKNESEKRESLLLEELSLCNKRDKQTAFALLEVYLSSVK